MDTTTNDPQAPEGSASAPGRTRTSGPQVRSLQAVPALRFEDWGHFPLHHPEDYHPELLSGAAPAGIEQLVDAAGDLLLQSADYHWQLSAITGAERMVWRLRSGGELHAVCTATRGGLVRLRIPSSEPEVPHSLVLLRWPASGLDRSQIRVALLGSLARLVVSAAVLHCMRERGLVGSPDEHALVVMDELARDRVTTRSCFECDDSGVILTTTGEVMSCPFCGEVKGGAR